MKGINTWKNNEGNICFNYKMRQPMEKPWIIITIGIFFIFIFLIEYYFYSSIYSIPILFLLFFFLFIYWCFYSVKENEVVNKEMMNKNVNLRLHNLLRNYDIEVNEVRRKFYQKTKGTYGIVSATYMLILLSNDEIIAYELKFHGSTDYKSAYFEFVTKPILSENTEFRKVIAKKTFNEFFSKLKLSEKAKLSIILFLLLTLGSMLTFILIWSLSTLKIKVLYIFGSYFVFYFLFKIITSKFDNNFVKLVDKILSFPGVVVSSYLRLMLPVFTIFVSYFCLFMITLVIPLLVVKNISFFLNLDFSWATTLFLSLSFGTIVSVYGSKFVHWIIKEYSPLKDWENHDYQALQVDLALYVLNKKNVNFLIYLAYLIYLSISGFLQIQYGQSLITSNIDASILKSFLVFIAFSNVVGKSKDIDIEVKPLLSKIIKLITS